VLGTEPSYIDLAAGAFDVHGEGSHPNRAAVGRVEFRWGEKLFFIGPAIGVLATTDGSVYGYAGVYSDIVYKRLVVTPVAAVGAYHRGDGKDLGGTLAFRIGIGLAYEFQDLSRLGIRLDHISNAHWYANNPGEEELLLSYSVPLGAIFRDRQ